MVTAIINISKESNRVLNILKAKHGLRTKSEAIDKLIREYEDLLPEPEVRPEYVKKMLKTRQQKTVYVGTAEEFARDIELRVARYREAQTKSRQNRSQGLGARGRVAKEARARR
jgi:hypothetical protein